MHSVKYVQKRGSRGQQPLDEEKIRRRILQQAMKLDQNLDAAKAMTEDLMKVVPRGLVNAMHTAQIDTYAAEEAAGLSSQHYLWDDLAARLSISNLHKETDHKTYLELAEKLYAHIHPKTGKAAPLVSQELLAMARKHREAIEEAIDYERDYLLSYFGFKTMCRAYLLRINGRIMERPQDMWMRVSLGIWAGDDNIKEALQTYHMMSRLHCTHATPTLFNAGTCTPQCSSCFLLTMDDDSIEGIYQTITRCARISKLAGGIGVNISNIRAAGSYIKGTNGTSNGLAPMLRVLEATARYVDQGGGKRKGSFAVYLEPWHADLFEWLEQGLNTGPDEDRARDLFYGLWIPDLFMERLNENGVWSLMDPAAMPKDGKLYDFWGDEFKELYLRYENDANILVKQVPAQDIWWRIFSVKSQKGMPYIMWKDACNRKSNHQHLGTIRGSNLCTEIVEFTKEGEEDAVCNLASWSAPVHAKVTRSKDGRRVVAWTYDFDALQQVIRQLVRNCNRVIEINRYPTEQGKKSNLLHLPIGIGTQGLADLFLKLQLPFDSPEAAKLNRDIAETVYYAAVTESIALAEKHGPHPSYPGSPMSKGVLQFDMWEDFDHSTLIYDWDKVRADLAKSGVRNSLLIANMPTTSTSQMLRNNQSIEPFTAFFRVRKTLAGEFQVPCEQLIKELEARDAWDDRNINQLLSDMGSVLNLHGLEPEMKAVYKTAYELSQRVAVIDMSLGRAPFIDQAESRNYWMESPEYGKFCSFHNYSWSKGEKNGSYYSRWRNRIRAKDISTNVSKLQSSKKKREEVKSSFGVGMAHPYSVDNSNSVQEEGAVCNRDDEECLVCGS